MLRENLRPATPRTSENLGAQIDAPVLLKDPSLAARLRNKKFLFVHELGFRIQQAGRETSILYTDLESVSIKSSDLYSSGIHYATRFDIQMLISGQVMKIQHLDSDDAKDPFQAFLARLIASLADLFETTKSLRAKDWVLDGNGFRWVGGNLAWDEISYVDVVDQQVCIWKSTEAYPSFRAGKASPQALILNEILERHTKKHPQKLSPDSLGRFLFSRRANKTVVNAVLFLAALLLGTGIWMLFKGQAWILPAFLLMFLSGPAALYVLFSIRRTFHFFQNGIVQEPGHKVLFFHRCESLVYDTNLQLINGVYAFTRIRMDLHGPGGSMKIKIQCFGNDQEMEQTRVEASMKISERLYQKVLTQGQVGWGKWARISQHEVRYYSTKIVGSNIRAEVPFTQPISYSIDSGKFYLFRAGEQTPVFEMDCNEENFYPGFFLLLKLVAEH